MDFSITATDIEWLDSSKDCPDDYCLHGLATAVIGEQIFECSATISSTALYLLKTLTENHIINADNQLLPCCGHTLIPDEELNNVTIIGCPYGADWSVIHDGDNVILETEDGTRVIVPIDEYKAEVFRFADMVEEFYLSCSPKELPEDEFERNGYTAFWNEWHRRRGNK